MDKSFITIRNVNVSVQEMSVLNRIDIDVISKSVTGIVYENDLERECLLKLFTEYYKPDVGEIRFSDNIIDNWVIGKRSNLFDELGICDNIYLTVSHKYKKRLLMEELLLRFDIRMDINKRISKLSELEKIKLELLQGYVLKKRCMILYEISNKLSEIEILGVLPILRKLCAYGYAFIILDSNINSYISCCSRLYIIQNGCIVQSLRDAEIAEEYNVIWMPEDAEEVQKNKLYSNSINNISLSNFCIRNFSSENIKKFNLVLKKGQLVKIIYDSPAAANDFINAFSGELNNYTGSIYFGNKELRVKGYKEILKNKIGIVPSNPLHTMLYEDLSVEQNLLFPLSYRVQGVYMKKGYIRAIRKNFSEYIDPDIYGEKVKNVNIETKISIIYIKWLLFIPNLLLCNNPFPHFNIHTKGLVEKIMKKMTEAGITVVILAPKWPEYLDIPGEEVCLYSK